LRGVLSLNIYYAMASNRGEGSFIPFNEAIKAERPGSHIYGVNLNDAFCIGAGASFQFFATNTFYYSTFMQGLYNNFSDAQLLQFQTAATQPHACLPQLENISHPTTSLTP